MKTLVVARHEEDIGWLDQLPEDWVPLVVQKDVDIPNEGREASSYLWALQRLSVAPEDTLAFVQGNPFAHCEDLLELLTEPVTEFTYLGHWIPSDDHFGSPHHPGLALGEMFDKWIGGERPERFEFVAGAQFAIPGSLALKHDKDFYRFLFTEANKDPNAWVLERLWRYIFS